MATVTDGSTLTRKELPVGVALKRAFAKGYGAAELKADLMAGAVVGIVALPLSMALAIAVGAPPQHGLYTAIVGGGVAALVGGSKFQVTGPTAAFVVILAPIVAEHGLSGLLTAGFMAGIILLLMGAFRLGAMVRFIPYPVTTGFTTGIATVIATLQLKDALGLQIDKMPGEFHEKVLAIVEAIGTTRWQEALLAGTTLALLLGVPRVVKRIPAPLIAITVTSVLAAVLHATVPGFDVATIGSRFHATVGGVEVAGIPPVLPTPSLPWGSGLPSFQLIETLFPAAFAIAMLGAIESLLSAVIADGMTRTRHDSDAELVGQGLANIVAPLFGGIAATGALARTATNIRSGAKSPVSALTHAAVVLLAILLLAPAVAYVPMASLAGLLLLVAWNMSEVHHFAHLLRISPKSDIFVLVSCFLLTVFFDMVIAVGVGFVLAAVLFMRRMSAITESRQLYDEGGEGAGIEVPRGASLYQINGPLFFGAARQALDSLDATHSNYAVLILDLSRVPVIDATGFVALHSALESVRASAREVVLVGPLPRPREMFDKSKVLEDPGIHIVDGGVDAALALTRKILGDRFTAEPVRREVSEPV